MKLLTQALIGIVCVVLVVTAAGVYLLVSDRPQPPQQPVDLVFRSPFSTSFDDWTPNGTDLDDPPVQWKINHTKNATSDNGFLTFWIANFNDAGKIWVERTFVVPADRSYFVEVSFKLGTSDFGDFNLFRIITSVLASSPKNASDLQFQDDTGTGLDSENFTWLNKTYPAIVSVGADGLLYVNVGVWGTWETNRTYLVDDITVHVKELTEASPPTIAGSWTVTVYSGVTNDTSRQNLTIDQDGDRVTFLYESGVSCEGRIVPNLLARPDISTDFIVVGCDVPGQKARLLYVFDADTMEGMSLDCVACGTTQFMRR